MVLRCSSDREPHQDDAVRSIIGTKVFIAAITADLQPGSTIVGENRPFIKVHGITASTRASHCNLRLRICDAPFVLSFLQPLLNSVEQLVVPVIVCCLNYLQALNRSRQLALTVQHW